MQIKKVRRDCCHQIDSSDLVVVIDVIRAFTTAAFAFLHGAEKIILVSGVDEAFLLQKKYPQALLMGEQSGVPVEGFHFGNSPVDIMNGQIKGRTLIQRTSSGTQGVVSSQHADIILTASFVNAEATLKHIRALNPQRVTFVITCMTKGGDEDLALADYLEKRLLNENVDTDAYLQRVVDSAIGKAFLSGDFAHFPKADLEACLRIDTVPLACQVFREAGELTLRAIQI